MGLRVLATVGSVLFLLAALVRPGSALRCWTCSSDLSPECADPMNNTEHYSLFHIKDCEATLAQQPYIYERTVCSKIVQRVHGERVVVRSCATPGPDERDITDGPCNPVPSASYITVESCHICSNDLCNSATSASALTALYAACAVALLAWPAVRSAL